MAAIAAVESGRRALGDVLLTVIACTPLHQWHRTIPTSAMPTTTTTTINDNDEVYRAVIGTNFIPAAEQ